MSGKWEDPPSTRQWVHVCAGCGKRWKTYSAEIPVGWVCPPCDLTKRAAFDPEEGLAPDAKAVVRIKPYRLVPGQVERMAEDQGGVCAICGRAPYGVRGLVVDHNHLTGEVRGLLCQPCNSAIGQLQDSPVLLAKAAAYLTERGNYAGMKRQPFPGTVQPEGAK